ncbi:NAD-dependent epimerase/dehydratase family protein [Pseudomonadota bacterium]
MAKYIVTGGCGFIGSHLAESLILQGDDVVIVDNLSTGKLSNAPSQAKVVVGDVRNATMMKELMLNASGCFHLAAISSVERSADAWVDTHSTNLTGTITVLDAARGTKSTPPVPVVYASSAAVYGDNASTPLAEDAALRPLSAYGADKLGSELHARIAGIIHNVPSVGFRFFNVYGPRQDPHSPYSGVISIFADRILRNSPITIYGDGNQVRDFVYVKDVVNFLIGGIKTASTGTPIYNVCTGRSTSIRQLVHTLFAVTGKQVAVSYSKSRRGDIRTSIGAPQKAQLQLGLRANVDLGQGLRQTYRTECDEGFTISVEAS